MNAEQLKIIAENSPREAATILNIHIRNVRYYKQRMEGKNVQKECTKNYKKWTQEEDEYLLRCVCNSTYSELQTHLKTSRRQIDHRCKILGVSPKKLKHHKILTREEQEICLQEPLAQAAKRLGISVTTVKRRKKELIKMSFDLCDTEKSVAFDKVVEVKQPNEQIEERLRHVLNQEKTKTEINEILFQFQGMTAGQIRQMELIYSYSPKSAVRYCEVIKFYEQNYFAYTPARIRSGG